MRAGQDQAVSMVADIAGLVLGAADQAAAAERECGLFDRSPPGDSLGLYLLAFEAWGLLPPGRTVAPIPVSPEVVVQLRAAERLTRRSPIGDFPAGMVGVIAGLCDEIRIRTP